MDRKNNDNIIKTIDEIIIVVGNGERGWLKKLWTKVIKFYMRTLGVNEKAIKDK